MLSIGDPKTNKAQFLHLERHAIKGRGGPRGRALACLGSLRDETHQTPRPNGVAGGWVTGRSAPGREGEDGTETRDRTVAGGKAASEPRRARETAAGEPNTRTELRT